MRRKWSRSRQQRTRSRGRKLRCCSLRRFQKRSDGWRTTRLLSRTGLNVVRYQDKADEGVGRGPGGPPHQDAVMPSASRNFDGDPAERLSSGGSKDNQVLVAAPSEAYLPARARMYHHSDPRVALVCRCLPVGVIPLSCRWVTIEQPESKRGVILNIGALARDS